MLAQSGYHLAKPLEMYSDSCFSNPYFVSRDEMAPRSIEGGLLNAPVRRNWPSFSILPISYCITPLPTPAGVDTTISPRRISFFFFDMFGTPPPIPTIRPNRMEGKLNRIVVDTTAAEFVPI